MLSYPAKYTVVLKSLLDNEQTKALINEALNNYPIYNPISKNEFIPRIVPTREDINNAILNHYKYREIGFETVGRFIDELKTTMNEIMPYYNQLLFTQDQDFNIIYNVDYKRTIDTARNGQSTTTAEGNAQSTNNGTSSTTNNGESETNTTGSDTSNGSSSSSDNSKHVETDTPQGSLSITGDNIDNVDYASKVAWDKSGNTSTTETTGTTNTNSKNESSNTSNTTNADTQNTETHSTNTGTTNDTEQTLETTKGNFGVVSAQDLVLKYRETILNIQQMIVNDKRIKELFMLVY